MSDITEFLLARIAEDERNARKLAETDRRPVLSLATTVNHPQRLLAEAEAKRAIIKWVNRWPLRPHAPSSVDGVLEMLAAIYADHPDYREEWKTLTQRG